MFKATLGDSKFLKGAIDTISNIVDEGSLCIKSDGVSLMEMDAAHVALVDLMIGKESFDEFEVSEDIRLGLDLQRLDTILKRAGPGDVIVLDLDEDKNQLRVRVKDKSTRSFGLPLLDLSDEEFKMPVLDTESEVEILPDILKTAIKDAEVVGDAVKFRTDADNFYVEASGDLGSVKVRVAKEEMVDFKSGGEVTSGFSLDYLSDMIRASELTDTVKISLGTDLPVVLEFKGDGFHLNFLVAPRVEGE